MVLVLSTEIAYVRIDSSGYNLLGDEVSRKWGSRQHAGESFALTDVDKGVDDELTCPYIPGAPGPLTDKADTELFLGERRILVRTIVRKFLVGQSGEHGGKFRRATELEKPQVHILADKFLAESSAICPTSSYMDELTVTLVLYGLSFSRWASA